MQVGFASMLVDADHAALEDREHAFDGVGVNHFRAFGADMFAASVIGGLVRGVSSPVRA